MFIYKISNTINKKVYIGQTVRSIKRRFNQHCLSKRSIIGKAIQKYGREYFSIKEISGANSLAELNYQEWLLVYKYNSLAPNGYNLKEGGGSRGKSTDYSKKRMSLGQKKYFSENESNRNKVVINIKTGKKYKSVKDAAETIGMRYRTLVAKLNGGSGNETELRMAGKEEKSKPYIGTGSMQAGIREIYDVITGEVFSCVKDAELKNKIYQHMLGHFLRTRYRVYKNLSFVNPSQKEIEIYNKNHKKRVEVPVINIETEEVWESAKIAYMENNIKIGFESFRRLLLGKVHNTTNLRYIDRQNLNKEYSGNGKKVQNIETGEVFDSIQKALDNSDLDISHETLRRRLNGTIPEKGFNFKYLESKS